MQNYVQTHNAVARDILDGGVLLRTKKILESLKIEGFKGNGNKYYFLEYVKKENSCS